jgi:hypothetical protein
MAPEPGGMMQEIWLFSGSKTTGGVTLYNDLWSLYPILLPGRYQLQYSDGVGESERRRSFNTRILPVELSL